MDIQNTSEHQCAHLSSVRPRSVEERETRTRASTDVLARVLSVPMTSKGQTGHEQALMCSLVSSVSPWHRRDRDKDIQDTGEHRCARSCPVHPRGVEERETKARASTNVLAHVLCIRAVSKREKQGHEQAPMCSLVSRASTWS